MAKQPWKKNFRSVPPHIQAQVLGLDTDDCIVSCASKLDLGKIQSGLFSHIGIAWDGNSLTFTRQVLPPAESGVYSRRNIYGYEVVHRDRPKTTTSWSVDVPNYGDWSKGYHDINFTRETYQREFVGPKLLSIQIEHIGEDIRTQAHVFKFSVPELLHRNSSTFWDDLLFNLNLLQENVGNCGVQASDADIESYLETLYINWEILPPGEKEETLVRILSGVQTNDPAIRARIAQRYDFLRALNPRNFIKGINEFRRYFGAQFADDLVVFENIEYGNAIYVMYERWEELSKKPRTELLRSGMSDFDRIPHTKTWQLRLRRLISDKLARSS